MAATTASAQCHTSDRIQPAAGQSRAPGKTVGCGALRVAGLCIGVDKYKHIGTLSNAVRDAEQVHEKLNAVPRCRCGIVKDPKIQIDMLSSVRTFLDDPCLREEPPELFVLSYAGHSIQREGEVYLVPTDAKLENEAEDCAIECLSLGRLLQLLRDKLDVPVRQKMGQDRAIVFLVVLDSCRTHTRGHSALDLLAVEPAPGSAPLKYTLFLSCSRTTTASDGPSGGHSPFAQALLDEKHGFFAEGVTLRDAIANVKTAVEQKGHQKPVEYEISTIPRHFCIRPSAGGAPGGTADGGSAGAGGGHKRKRQMDADVLALLREWELEDESELLAEKGVCKMKDLESMKEEDVEIFGCRLHLRELLQHVAKQKENKRASAGSKEHKVHHLIKLGQYAEVKHLMPVAVTCCS
jgi:hypothetical protein